jgi:AraC-like DNA-binding protein
MPALTRLAANDAWSRAGVTSVGEGARGARSRWEVDRDQHGRIEVCDIGRVRIARIRANPLCIEQKNAILAADRDDPYRVLLQISGRSVLQQAGRQAEVAAGDWVLYRGAAPFSLMNLERCEQRMVILPRRELWSGTLDLEALTVRRFDAHGHGSRQLLSLLDTAFETASMFGEAAAVELAAAAVHLSRLALIESCGTGLHRVRSEVILDRIRGYIERNLRDPGLSVAGIAAALNCSTRYLHKVFAEGDETIAEYILRLRLERCFSELTRPAMRAVSIAELAYSWGFKSVSHFGKAFSRRYGMTPSESRAHFGSQPVPAL